VTLDQIDLVYVSSVPLPLLLSTGLLPMIYVAATVVLKQKGTCSIEAIPRVPTEHLYVGHVLRVWFEGMPAAISWPGGGTWFLADQNPTYISSTQQLSL
jgi:hypothetical protein